MGLYAHVPDQLDRAAAGRWKTSSVGALGHPLPVSVIGWQRERPTRLPASAVGTRSSAEAHNLVNRWELSVPLHLADCEVTTITDDQVVYVIVGIIVIICASVLFFKQRTEAERTIQLGNSANSLLEPEERVLHTEKGVTALKIVGGSCDIAATNKRLIFLTRRGATAAEPLSYKAIEVREPDREGITVRSLTTGRTSKIRCSQKLGELIQLGVLGPSGAEGGSPDDQHAIGEVVYLGGYGSALVEGTPYVIVFRDENLIIRSSKGEVKAIVALGDLLELDFSGPGSYTTGGGFVGGGFGVEGAAKGILIASVVNSLTTRKHVKTVIRIRAKGLAAFFEHNRWTPEQLTMSLAEVLDVVNAADTNAVVGSDLADQLERLASLHGRGLIDNEEYLAAKRHLLS